MPPDEDMTESAAAPNAIKDTAEFAAAMDSRAGASSGKIEPVSGNQAMKDKVRAALAAQPFRGDAVHKDDLLAVIDALIDGPN